MDPALLLWLSFLAGIYAPVGSPCVIALYPAYLSFLAGGKEGNRPGASPFSLGVAIAAGVILSMLAGGLLFALLLATLGTFVQAAIAPAVFLLLLVFSLLLILDIDPFPAAGPRLYPRGITPHRAAFLLGLFMGIVILPCNAPVILVLLALAATATGALQALSVFLAFGAGTCLPLIVIAGISRLRGRAVAAFLARHRLAVRRFAGLVMCIIAAWYLLLIVFPGLPA